MKKSLSLLVAIAMVFSMFASVASADTQSNYDVLAEAGIFKGFPNGDAGLDKDMTRAEYAAVIARAANLHSDEVADFSDVAATHWAAKDINAVVEAGFMEGTGAGKFGPADKVTLEQMVTIAVRMLNLDESDAEVEGTVSAWAKGFVAAALEAKLFEAKADYTVNATRGDLVDVTFAVYQELSKPAVATATAKATGAKKIEVAFNKAIDTTKAKFAVKNGIYVRDVVATTFSDDKKSAVLELSTKLAAGATVVTISGVEAEDIKAEFTAVDEKVTEIQFIGDKAAVATKTDGSGEADYTKIAIGYKLVNNYGEDVTKTAGGKLDIQVGRALTTGTANATSGTVELVTTGTQFALNETVYVNAILNLTTYGVTASKQITVGQQAMVDSIDILELWNSEKKELQTGFAANTFYILVDAKDQYGKKVTLDQFKKGVFAVASNPALFTVDANQAVDGMGPNNDKLALPLIQPTTTIPVEGTNTVRITTLFGGKSDSIDVPVKKAATVTAFTLNPPAQVVSAGQTVKIPFTAADQNGNALTKFSDINDTKVKVEASTGTVTIKQDYTTKDAYVEYVAPNVKTVAFLTARIENTATISQLQLQIEDALVATSVTGLKDVNASLAVGATVGIENKHVVVKDQYGRDVKLNDVVGTHYVKLSAADGNADVVSGFGILDVADDKVTLSALKKGTERIKIELVKKVGNIDDAVNNEAATASTKDEVVSVVENFTISVVDKDGIKSYAVADIAKISNASAAHAVEVKVEGVREDGSKVTLPTSAYTVTPTAPLSYNIADNKLSATGVTDGFTNGERKLSYTVTIIATNEPITKEIVVSNATPVAASYELKDAGALKGSGTVVKGPFGSITVANILSAIKVKDQFGVELALNEANYTVTLGNPDDVDTKDLTFINNGQAASAVMVDKVEAGDSFSVTIISRESNAAFNFRVVAEK